MKFDNNQKGSRPFDSSFLPLVDMFLFLHIYPSIFPSPSPSCYCRNKGKMQRLVTIQRSPNSSFISLYVHHIYGLLVFFVITIMMFVFCYRNEGKGFMLIIVKKASREHELSLFLFCIPSLFVHMSVTITIVLQLGRHELFQLFFCILGLSIHVSIAITIALQSRGPELSHLSLFIYEILPCF